MPGVKAMEQLVNLKRFRQKMNLTQAAAAKGIGIDQRQWNRYENGKNEISVKYLRDICIRYKVSADWLLGLDDGDLAEEENKT